MNPWTNHVLTVRVRDIDWTVTVSSDGETATIIKVVIGDETANLWPHLLPPLSEELEYAAMSEMAGIIEQQGMLEIE